MEVRQEKMELSDKEIERIYYDEYARGISTVKLEKKYSHDHSYFLRRFKKLKLPIKNNKINSRKYIVNDNYFSKIDKHEKAYWLGFIYADGYITSSNGKKLGITLSSKDRDHLETFIQCLNATYPIKDYSVTGGYKIGIPYSRVLISSDKIYNDLILHGVVERKSLIKKYPIIDDHLINSFILGYFDGNGSIYLNNTKYPFYSISITSTDDVLCFIHNYFKSKGYINYECKLKKRQKKHIISYIRYGGNILVKTILSDLYNNIDTKICLKRKYDLYINCKNRVFE
jgi:DNA-binding transcriptional regulator WhiA